MGRRRLSRRSSRLSYAGGIERGGREGACASQRACQVRLRAAKFARSVGARRGDRRVRRPVRRVRRRRLGHDRRRPGRLLGGVDQGRRIVSKRERRRNGHAGRRVGRAARYVERVRGGARRHHGLRGCGDRFGGRLHRREQAFGGRGGGQDGELGRGDERLARQVDRGAICGRRTRADRGIRLA